MKLAIALSVFCLFWLTVMSLTIQKEKDDSTEENRGLIADFDDERKAP
jgi:hypothetical protein